MLLCNSLSLAEKQLTVIASNYKVLLINYSHFVKTETVKYYCFDLEIDNLSASSVTGHIYPIQKYTHTQTACFMCCCGQGQTDGACSHARPSSFLFCPCSCFFRSELCRPEVPVVLFFFYYPKKSYIPQTTEQIHNRPHHKSGLTINQQPKHQNDKIKIEKKKREREKNANK